MDKSIKRSQQISVEGEKAIAELTKRFEEHCENSNKLLNDRNDKLDSLIPLVDLIPVIPTVKDIIERENEQKAVSQWMTRVGKFLGVLAGIITAVGIIASAVLLVIKSMFFLK